MIYLAAILSFIAGAGLASYIVFLKLDESHQYRLKNRLLYPENNFDKSIVDFYHRYGYECPLHLPASAEQSPLIELLKISNTTQPAFIQNGILQLYDGRSFPVASVINQAHNVIEENYVAMDKASYLILELNKVYDELTESYNDELTSAFARDYLPEHERPDSIVAGARIRYQQLAENPGGILIETFRPHTKYPLEKEILQTATILHLSPDKNDIAAFGGDSLWRKAKEYFYQKDTPYIYH